MKKTGLFFLASIINGILLSGCLSFTGNVSEIPARSSDSTPFEGTWYGTFNNIPYELEFRGNTFVSKSLMSDSGNTNQTTDIWGKGFFTYTDNTIVYYTLNSYNPQSNLYSRWTRPQEGMKQGKTSKLAAKYSFNTDALTIDKTRYIKRDKPVSMPEEFVFFYNPNNFMVNHNADVKNGEVFTIEKIDDKELSKFSFPMLGSGYWAVEQREPGIHRITFRQKLKKTEAGYYKTNAISGYFRTDFAPGVYRFFLFSDEYAMFMPQNLPAIPTGTARVVIASTNLEDGVEKFYKYIDIPIN
jgi:hypothetical protein